MSEDNLEIAVIGVPAKAGEKADASRVFRKLTSEEIRGYLTHVG